MVSKNVVLAVLFSSGLTMPLRAIAQTRTNSTSTNSGTQMRMPAQTAPVNNQIAAPAQRMVRKRTSPKPGSSRAFYYLSANYFSFADQIFAKVSGQKQHARSVFTGYSFGTDYTHYIGRYIYSWNISVLTGMVDIQRVLGVTYPRKSFWGASSGPELGYRVNSDTDLSWGLNLLYRDIDKVGASFALSNQLNIKYRFTPRLTFFQSIGNYGKPTSYSYSIGMRWLL